MEKILIYLYDTQRNGYNLDGGGNVHLASKESKKDGSYTVFKSVNEALKYLGKKDKSSIYHHLKGDRPTAYGYRWEYLEME